MRTANGRKLINAKRRVGRKVQVVWAAATLAGPVRHRRTRPRSPTPEDLPALSQHHAQDSSRPRSLGPDGSAHVRRLVPSSRHHVQDSSRPRSLGPDGFAHVRRTCPIVSSSCPRFQPAGSVSPGGRAVDA